MKLNAWLFVGLFLLSLLFQVVCSCPLVSSLTSSPNVDKPTYLGIATYYDNRKCAVTVSLDDFGTNSSDWQNALSMLTQKRIFHSVGIITAYTDWNYAQYWINQGYTEAASHSRTHVPPPYTGNDGVVPKISDEWQINGSKQDIIGNLTLPAQWRSGENQFVYAWIEPFGEADAAIRQWLGTTHYLCDRTISPSAPSYGYAYWDAQNGLFTHVGYTVEMGSPPWKNGATSVASLNRMFDQAYFGGSVYHLNIHPPDVNWSKGSYADLHTDYISNRTDVWYVPLGLLYLYHWLAVENVTQVSSNETGQLETFNITINHESHRSFGAAYPASYVFNIPQNWTTANVYYRYKEQEPWQLLSQRKSTEFFNGVSDARFNFTENKAYVSIGFSNSSDNIFLRILPSKLTAVSLSPNELSVERGRKAGAALTFTLKNTGQSLMHAILVSVVNSSQLKVLPPAENLSDIENQQTESATFSVSAPSTIVTGIKNISFRVNYCDATGAVYSETLSAPVVVTKLGTSIHVSAFPPEIKKDQTTILDAKLLDENANPIAHQAIAFSVGTNSLGCAKTDVDGNAVLNYTFDGDVGTNLVTVSYGENESYLSSIGSTNLKIDKLETNITAMFSSSSEKTLTFNASVRDENGNPVKSATLEFQTYNKTGWLDFANSTTDAKGFASISYPIATSGFLQLRTKLDGGINYFESTSSTISILVINLDYIIVLAIVAAMTVVIATGYKCFRKRKKKNYGICFVTKL